VNIYAEDPSPAQWLTLEGAADGWYDTTAWDSPSLSSSVVSVFLGMGHPSPSLSLTYARAWPRDLGGSEKTRDGRSRRAPYSPIWEIIA